MVRRKPQIVIADVTYARLAIDGGGFAFFGFALGDLPRGTP
jgi:hypothetical protein